MIYLIAYLVIAVISYRFFYSYFRDSLDNYTTDGEVQLGALICGLVWFLAIPLTALWTLATLGRPTTPAQRGAQRKAEIAEQEKALLIRKIEWADREHENGYEPIDPPEGWVPKDHPNRYYSVDMKLRRW